MTPSVQLLIILERSYGIKSENQHKTIQSAYETIILVWKLKKRVEDVSLKICVGFRQIGRQREQHKHTLWHRICMVQLASLEVIFFTVR